jgi:hypothetical protein
MLDMHFGYLMLGLPFGIPYRLEAAYFLYNALVALVSPTSFSNQTKPSCGY